MKAQDHDAARIMEDAALHGEPLEGLTEHHRGTVPTFEPVGRRRLLALTAYLAVTVAVTALARAISDDSSELSSSWVPLIMLGVPLIGHGMNAGLSGRVRLLPLVGRVPQGGIAGLDRTFPGERLRRSRAPRSGWRMLDGAAWLWLHFAVDVLMLVVAVGLSIVAAGGSPAGLGAIWLYPVLAVAVMWLRGMYAHRHQRSVLDVLVAAFVAMSLATMASVTAIAFAGLGQQGEPHALRVWLISVVLLSLGRTELLLIQRWARRTGRVGKRALIIGAGEIGSKVLNGLDQRPDYGIVPVGMLEVRPVDGDRRVSVVGTPGDMLEVAQRMRAECVILAFSNVPDRQLLTQVRRCQAAGLEVSIVPRLFESLNKRVEVSHVGTLPLMSLHGVDPAGWQFKLKYVLDRVIAALALIVLLPLFLAIAVSVKLTSQGPVFFRQRRVGLDAHVFDVLKFRSMDVDREEDDEFVPSSGLAPGGVEGIDRRTAVGRVLRRTSLDELPQLINVLRGDMSFVGPRPERPEYVARFESQVRRYGERHRAKSGITGWAQVHGLRGQTSLSERIEFDNQYIDNWSLGMDLRIVLLTLPAVFSHRSD